MSPEDSMTIARELGAISQNLKSMNERLVVIESHVKETNGRVKQHDVEIAVLQDRDERDQENRTQLHEKVKDLEGRPRLYALGIGGPVLAALATVVLSHV